LGQWKNEIAHNSDYDQTQTFNFTFAQEAIMVYFYLNFNLQEIAMLIAKY